jgi:hypothetical protein
MVLAATAARASIVRRHEIMFFLMFAEYEPEVFRISQTFLNTVVARDAVHRFDGRGDPPDIAEPVPNTRAALAEGIVGQRCHLAGAGAQDGPEHRVGHEHA